MTRAALLLIAILVSSCVPGGPKIPTSMPSPTAESPVLPAASPTPHATVAPTATLSEEAERAFIAATLVSAGDATTGPSSPSPDGQWVAEVLRQDCTPVTIVNEGLYALETLQIRNSTTTEARVVESQLQTCGGLGAAGLSARSWSQNSRYLYYTVAASGVPEGCGWWIPPLKRLDVSAWSIDDLGSGPLSPDGQMRATWQGTTLLLSSVEQGDVTHIDPIAPDMVLGEIAWSPANAALVYLLTEFDCYPWGTTYVVRVDLSTSSSRILLQSASPSFAWVEWSVPNRLLLWDQDDIPWTYDMVTGALRISK